VEALLQPVQPESVLWSQERIGRVRTKEEITAMQDDLIRGLAYPPFQQQLHAAWERSVGSRQQESSRRQLCLEVQGPILELHGFENSHRGLFQSHLDCRLEDSEVGIKAHVLDWLTHPAHGIWRCLWPELATFCNDLSYAALKQTVERIYAEKALLDNQDRQQGR